MGSVLYPWLHSVRAEQFVRARLAPVTLGSSRRGDAELSEGVSVGEFPLPCRLFTRYHET